MAYVSVPDLRAYMSIADSVDDAVLSAAVDAATAWVDRKCGRTFTAATAATARTYFSDGGGTVWPDDIAAVTGLIVKTGRPGAYTTTLVQDTDFYLSPPNAVALGKPYTQLRGSFPTSSNYATVQVTALWGWPVVPSEVAMATLLTASRLFKRRESPEGVAGFGDFGAIRVTSTDPDVERLLGPYILPVVA